MASWDTAVSKKCPGCGGNLLYDANLRSLVCKYCGNIYDPETMDSGGNLETRDLGEEIEETDGRCEIICDNCGAVVVTGEETAASFCAFCGSPSIIRRRLSHEFRPDYILPFSITKQQAKENLKNFIKAEKKAPRKFYNEKNLDNLTGVYVPFWLIDAKCHTDVVGAGIMMERGINMKSTYNIDRTISFYVKDVPFDGSKRISNMLMEAVEPFDLDKLEPYSDAYIPGFYAQRYDESALEMTDRIQSRLDAHARQFGKLAVASEYQHIRVNSDFSKATDFSQSYALLPVWFANLKYKKFTYPFAVNGQTGKAAGEVPFDPVKRNLKLLFFRYILPAVPFLLLPLGIVVDLIAYLTELYFLVGLGTFFCAFSIPAIIWLFPWFRRMRKEILFESTVHMDPAPKVEHFIDYKKKIEMEKRDSPAFVTVYEPEGESHQHFL